MPLIPYHGFSRRVPDPTGDRLPFEADRSNNLAVDQGTQTPGGQGRSESLPGEERRLRENKGGGAGMTSAFAGVITIHAIGLLVTALSGIAAYRDGIMFGLALIMVSDALLILADRNERRNGTT